MPSASCFLKNPFSWIPFLGLILAYVFTYGAFLPILFTSFITLLTLVLNFPNQKPVQPAQEIRRGDEENISRIRESKKEEDDGEEDNSLARSSTSEEDSEVEWLFQDKIFRSSECSDGSISDEESLIEIALPSGHYIGHKHKQDNNKVCSNKMINMEKKLPDFHGGLMELLAELNEMNEEENLIEIDISIGSIKYPRFEIEA